MDERKLKDLESRLRDMFNEKPAPKKQPKPAGKNVVIRRRKGEKDKRIHVSGLAA